MNANAVEGTLLNVRLDQDQLCLCLDTERPWQEQEMSEPVVTACLGGCQDAAEAQERLSRYVGASVWLEPVEEAGSVVGAFLTLDYGDNEMQVACDRITQEYRGYTPEEWGRKYRWLTAAYTRCESGRIAVERKHGGLTVGLTQMIEGELDRSRRKLEFFRRTNPERASEMQGRMAAYERVLMRMAQLREAGEGAV